MWPLGSPSRPQNTPTGSGKVFPTREPVSEKALFGRFWTGTQNPDTGIWNPDSSIQIWFLVSRSGI